MISCRDTSVSLWKDYNPRQAQLVYLDSPQTFSLKVLEYLDSISSYELLQIDTGHGCM